MVSAAAPSDDDLLATLARHATRSESAGVRVVGVETVALKGGYVSKAVDRLDLTLETRDGASLSASFVRKACLAREVQALKVASAVPGVSALPDVIAAWISPERPDDPEANGFVTPVYAGPELHFGDPIPPAVIETLARVHAACADLASLGWTWTFDADHLARLKANTVTALGASERFKATTPDHRAWLQRLDRAGGDELLAAATTRAEETAAEADAAERAVRELL